MVLARSTVRLIAILFVFLTGMELVACDFTSHDQTTHFSDSSQHQSDDPCGCDDDGCLCCCSHVLLTATFSLPAVEFVADLSSHQQIEAPDSESIPLFRPPRA